MLAYFAAIVAGSVMTVVGAGVLGMMAEKQYLETRYGHIARHKRGAMVGP